MELSETSVQIRDCSIDFIPVYVKQENDERETDFNEVEIINAAQHFCAIEIKESKRYGAVIEGKESNTNSKDYMQNASLNNLISTLNPIEQNENYNINGILSGSMYLQNLDYENVNIEIQKPTSQISEIFIDHNEQIQSANYSISAVTIPSELLGLNLNIKKEDELDQETVYTTEWLCNVDNESNLRSNPSKNAKKQVEVPINIEATITPVTEEQNQTSENGNNVKTKESKHERSKRQLKIRSLQDYKEKLRRKAECMREKRKKLYEQESEEQRLERLAKEAAKRREMRMYYETPEQRRKRLDAEAARKREYRMYNETPEDRRKRLDREAERRRMKRLSLYATETPEERRERLNRESAKRREARLNQYAKETQEERKERLRRDALRVREMRFTRSAIETEEERRQRLVKDAIRKREVRMHGGYSVNNNFTELQTVRNFEELNNVQIKENPDNQLGGHYLSNWMMWFQNSLAQPVHIGEQIGKPRLENNG
ncbi:histone-lysine N-methyltransferase, H3 lysine-79 specific-like isoform X1 [Hylaeus volcanicus]|uniref:histone-lysine N-methyltransferase, H3 lysine-79 specific-like isoform X1 n=2 Tax=Hylaeus volcanicus TaxID=313075 RepID=UPI0023B79DC0|nr:histone-lysine N-methyltransferase, H3 lysine-79 specific-like isoform X1 [Hylaeus volcanicus]